MRGLGLDIMRHKLLQNNIFSDYLGNRQGAVTFGGVNDQVSARVRVRVKVGLLLRLVLRLGLELGKGFECRV